MSLLVFDGNLTDLCRNTYRTKARARFSEGKTVKTGKTRQEMKQTSPIFQEAGKPLLLLITALEWVRHCCGTDRRLHKKTCLDCTSFVI